MRLHFGWLVLLTSIGAAFAQESALERALQGFVKDPLLSHAAVGVMIHDLTNDRIVLHHQADLSLAPASTLKAVTTGTALDVLGSEHQYETILGYRGSVNQGILRGDLMIQGGGDPSLASRYLDLQGLERLLVDWVDAVKSAGITHIDGDIIADASLLGPEGTPGSWQYQDLGNYYGAGTYAINVHDNQYSLRFQQGASEGDKTSIHAIQPKVPGLLLENRVTTGKAGSGDQAYIYHAPFGQQGFITGTLPPGTGIYTIKGAIPDPALFLAFHLFEWLSKAGITCRGKALGLYNAEEQVKLDQILFRKQSPPLLQLVKVTNGESVNLFAEAIGKSTRVDMKEYWEDRGLSTEGIKFVDVSGLSKDNLVTPAFMTEFLSEIYRDKPLHQQLKSSLNVAGKSGNLRSMFKDSALAGKMWAKSGLISGVRSYIGYFTTDKADYAFSILTQNFTCSQRAMSGHMRSFMLSMYAALSE